MGNRRGRLQVRIRVAREVSAETREQGFQTKRDDRQDEGNLGDAPN